jgi:hypothetical protein
MNTNVHSGGMGRVIMIWIAFQIPEKEKPLLSEVF